MSKYNNLYLINQAKKGIKRKADTTTPTTPVGDLVVEPVIIPAKAAKIPTRRESTRTVKKPNRDLPEGPSLVRECTFVVQYSRTLNNCSLL